jgi:activator of 2-hydroxyglutaryl-CoA dehydratase
MLVFDDKEAKTSPVCIVGADAGEQDLKAVLIFDDKGPVKLFEYSLKGRKQRTLWARGAT